MSARLHILLGEGGVGKTTLAAGYALALAQSGGRVALLGIDPARRLQSALGLSLGDGDPVRVAQAPGRGELHAALLVPEATLRRWATEGLADPAARDRLLANTLFAALADRLAATTDVIAAVRVAEWLDHDPSLTDLVVDTAPGLNGIDFLRRPAALVALLQGRLLRWLRHAGEGAARAVVGEASRGSGSRVLRSLGRLAGADMLVELAQLLSVVEQPFEQVLGRLERAYRWVHEPSTRIVLVTSVREDAVRTTRAARAALAAADLSPRAVVVNRALLVSLAAELGAIDEATLDPATADLTRYARAYIEMQARVADGVRDLAPSVVTIPAVGGLDSDRRLPLLADLGEELRAALESGSRGPQALTSSRATRE